MASQTFRTSSRNCANHSTECPNNKAVGSKPVVVDFTKGLGTFFSQLDGTKLEFDKSLGAIFTIDDPMQAPTIESEKTIFFGKVEVVVRAAQGAGIVTSLVLQSLDLDEIDWEMIGNDAAQVQANYFSKGCTTAYDRGSFHPVANPQAEFHTYTINWTPTKLDFIVNGAVVRTLNKAGLSGCSGYPQTPMQIKLGTWVGGRKDKPPGVIQWAGGLADFENKPPGGFTGYYQKVTVTDYMGGDGSPGSGASEATEYEWTDKSGDFGSIKVIGGDGKDSGDDKTTTTSSATKSSTQTSSSTTLSTVTSSSSESSSESSSKSSASGTGSASPSASPSGGLESSGSSNGTGSAGASKTDGANAPAQTSAKASGSEKLALPLGMGFAALIAALF